jgi:hypothetical protein
MENRNHARSYFQKAQEYLDSAQDNLDLEGATPAAGDAIHAGISAKDAIVTALTGETSKAKDHAKAAKDCARLSARTAMPRQRRSRFES